MSWLQLDSQSLAERTQGNRHAPSLLAASLARGVIGSTLVSLAGFASWAVFGKWFRTPGHGGEVGLYVPCALVFIILSGLFLHRLIMGAGSLWRFCVLFSIAFTAYSAAWFIGWMSLRGYPGRIVGLLAGNPLMGLIFVSAFKVRRQWLPVIAALFVLNFAGYFLGGVVEGCIIQLPKCELAGMSLGRLQQRTLVMLSWSLFYGIGLGAGLATEFYLCQQEVREILRGSTSI